MLSSIKRFVIYHLRDKYILRKARVNSYAHLNNENKKNILVMCYGNIYRSPFVEHFLRTQLNLNKFEIKSAGFHPKEDRQSPECHIRMSKSYSIDLQGHRSAKINHDLAEWADLIVIMDVYNWLNLSKFGKKALNKVVWLGMFKHADVQIHDPYNKSEDETKIVLDELYDCTRKLAELLN